MNYEITIPNWIKFNPRSDRANYTWFRVQNDILHDQKIFPLGEKEKLTYIFLLCEASKRNNGNFNITIAYGSAILRFKEKEVVDCIEVLNSCGVVTASRHHLVSSGHRLVSSLPATNERTNVTIRTNERTILSDRADPEIVKFDFELLYKKYPRKEGKQKGIKTCQTQIKSETDFKELSDSIDRYIEYCKKNNTDPKYIKHFSTFMNSWRDWLDPETGTSTQMPLKKNADPFALIPDQESA